MDGNKCGAHPLQISFYCQVWKEPQIPELHHSFVDIAHFSEHFSATQCTIL